MAIELKKVQQCNVCEGSMDLGSPVEGICVACFDEAMDLVIETIDEITCSTCGSVDYDGETCGNCN